MCNIQAVLPIAVLMIAPVSPGTQTKPSDPPNLAGRWTWKWMDDEGTTHQHELVVEGEPGRYAARERIDDEKPVKVIDLEIHGNEVSFAVLRGEVRAAYKGRFADSDTINGQVTIVDGNNIAQEYGWTAEKAQPEQPRDPAP